jgi:glycosyltransferase involved in cell wall biosynthesis
VIHARVISGKGGGPEKTILNSPRFLRPLGYQSVCLYLRDPGDEGFEIVEQRAADKQAPLVAVDDFGFFDWRVVCRTREAVAELVGQWGSGGVGSGGVGFEKGEIFGGPPLASLDPPGGRVKNVRPGADVTDKMISKTHCPTAPLPHSPARPLIWHGHDYKSNLLGLLLRRSFPQMRLVTTVHGWVQRTWKTPLYYAIDRRCLPRYEHVICVSRDLYDASQKHGVKQSALTLIDNAIALDDYEFETSKIQSRRTLKLPEDMPLAVAVGRLSAEKGFDVLIEAVRRINDAGQSLGLAIAGDGDQRTELQSIIDQTGYADRIKLLGFVSDPRLVYRAGDLYVLSSYREGLPNVVLEAMTMRMPVVCTKIAGMPDLVRDGENGLMVDAGDAEALRAAIDRLVADDGLSSKFSEAGRATIEQRFSFGARMEKVAAIYDRVLHDGD